MSRASKVRRDIKIFRANCLTRVPVLNEVGEEIENSCEHGPSGSMLWGDPSTVFCHECIHYQQGHVGHEEGEPEDDDGEDE
jgi:hypothetical protein